MSNKEPSQMLLRARDVMAWLKVTQHELDSWCAIHPDIAYVNWKKRGKDHHRGCTRYYRKHVIKVKILGVNGD